MPGDCKRYGRIARRGRGSAYRGQLPQGSRASKAIGKQALYAQLDRLERDAYTYAVEVMAATSQLDAAREGMPAFLDKRKPVWD